MGEMLVKQKPLTSLGIDWKIPLQAAENFCKKGQLSCPAKGFRTTMHTQPPPQREGKKQYGKVMFNSDAKQQKIKFCGFFKMAEYLTGLNF